MKSNSKQTLSLLFVLLSGVLWGVISVFIRPLSAAGLNAMQICFVRLLIAAPVFLIVTLSVSPSKMKFRLKDVWMFIGTGVVSVVLFNVCYFYTIIHSEASIAVVLLYTSPIFVMIFSILLFKEKIRLQKILSLLMTFAGCLLVSGVLGSGAHLRAIVLLAGLASGLFYALYSIFGTFALRRYDTLTVTTYTFLFAFAASLPFSNVKETFTVLSAAPTLWIWVLGIALVSTAAPYFFYTQGLKNLEPSRAAILVAVEPLVASLVGICFYGEAHGALKIIGILLVLGAIVVLNLPEKRKKTIDFPAKTDEK